MKRIHIVWMFVVFSVFTYVHGRLLKRSRSVTVRTGRSVFLRPEDLLFQNVRDNEECVVEVITNDPITQRVGYLEPQIFNCKFQHNTVRYVHNGSPLRRDDQIKLRVHKLNDKVTVSETFYINIYIRNVSTDVFVTDKLRPAIVERFNGLSNTINSSVLKFRHSGNQNVSCTVVFDQDSSHWPIAGQLVMGERRRQHRFIKKSCHEFLYMRLHYEHLRSPSPDIDYLPLSVSLYDPSISDEVITESLYFPIYIKGALQNSPPRASFRTHLMEVDQFVLSTIIPGVISAEDYETPILQLVYNISRPLQKHQGYYVNIEDHTTPITSFLQDDLENHRIAYQPPNISYSERRVYESEFTVYDSHFDHSMPIMLHILVRPSSTNAPRVSFNKGLTLMEGQSRAITTNNIQIVDRDNIHQVRIIVKGGMCCGRLEVNGRRAVYFTPADIEKGSVMYYHDDSDTMKDRIDLRISDGQNTVLAAFPITIIPKDDSPPYVLNNLGLELDEGELKRFRADVLLSHDTDSFDDNIVYAIKRKPRFGYILRKITPSEKGNKMNKFTQRELMKGQIYYQHDGGEKFKDSFEFILLDEQNPPNESDLETFHIDINPVNENPPRLSPNATRTIRVPETDIGYITKAHLRYTDVETGDRGLIYTVTSQPYFLFSSGREEAGRIINVRDLTMVMKDPSVPPTSTFTQADINHKKIAYMPPLGDIGPETRLVRFIYSVQDTSGDKIHGQPFDIELLPVNNQPPKFVTSKLLVEEGGILSVTASQISATDSDTLPEDLYLLLDVVPSHGVLQKSGVVLEVGDSFKPTDVRKKEIRYLHDGSEEFEDKFTLTLSDGVNKERKDIFIEIIPIDDQIPKLQSNIFPHLIVSEGGESPITPSILAAVDGDTEEDSLMFLVVKQPKTGILHIDGQPITKFNQGDVRERKVKFVHTGGEIGSFDAHDSFTFLISDKNFLAPADLPVHDMNITITPVNNQKPKIISGNPIFVRESEKTTISEDVITVTDQDSLLEDIAFMITQQPQWGYLENTKPSKGSEKSNAGTRIRSFKFQDVVDGTINYVQASHKGTEPVYDEFEIYATDGKLNSESIKLSLTIVPQNDEAPDVMMQDISVDEGGSRLIDRALMDAVDMDKPSDQLMMSISELPKHGDIVMMLKTNDGEMEAAIHDFSVDELHSGMKLKYRHDGSETVDDQFGVTVSDGKHYVHKMCNVTVRSMNDETPEITKNAGLKIDYGESALISSVVIQSMDPDNTDDEVFYIIVSVPLKGLLFYCSDPFSPSNIECKELEVGTNFTQRDIDLNKIKYVHTSSMGNSESDRFLFMLTDGVNKRPVETFEILIRNSRKSSIALLNRGIKVRESDRVVITTHDLSASDESMKAEEIVFAVIRPPRLGQVEYVSKPYVPISSFTQLDIASHQVVYHHMTKSDIAEDSLTFTVTNGMSGTKDGEFIIKIESLDKILPTLVHNELIEVLQGYEVTFTSEHLKSVDPDTSALNVTYIIVKPPTYGHLYNRGVLIAQSFSQNDVDLGYIKYKSDGTHAGLDNFLTSVSDGRHQGFLINGTLQTQPMMCSVYIKPLEDDPPNLLVNKHPTNLERFGRKRYGFRLNSRVLKAIDSDTDSAQLHYVITQKPKHGHIENAAAKRFVNRRFSQKDLNDNNLLYILDRRTDSTNDSFEFRIDDRKGNSLYNQRFDMRWSQVEFVKSDVVVCENIGTMTLTLSRSGALDQSAFVSVVVKDMSAKLKEDFELSSGKQVQFDPGMALATWSLKVEEDAFVESNEKFRLTLEDPHNSVIGSRRKMTVRIINANEGKCPAYLGMISKSQPEGSDGGEFDMSLFLPPVIEGSNQPTNNEFNKAFHSISKLNKKLNPFDNAYNTQPEDTPLKAKTDDKSWTKPSKPSEKPKSKSKKRKKGSRKSKRRRKIRNGKKKRKSRKKSSKPTADKGSNSYASKNQWNGKPFNLPHQKCTKDKVGLLLHVDLHYYQCNGKEWEAWNPMANKDQPNLISKCPPGWQEYQARCYKFFDEKKTWDDSEKYCSGVHRGHLTSLKSRSHWRWLRKQSGRNMFWLGLNDKARNGAWKYINGDEVNFANWKRGRPRIKKKVHRKHCVLVNNMSQFKNKNCDKAKFKFVCEVKLQSKRQSRRHLPRRKSRRQLRY